LIVVNLLSTPSVLTLLLLSAATWPLAALGDESGTAASGTVEEDSWAALVAETEELLEWSSDPLGDLDLEPERFTVWSTSARAGVGHSSNFLKRENPEGSRYLQLEGDAFVNTLFDEATLTALLFFEFTQYDQDTEADSESIVFLHANWSVFRDLWTMGIELDAFYGDQIYDASLSSVSPPVGDNLRQFRPELSFFAEKFISSRDSLGAKLSLRRAVYGESEEDYWRPALSLEWIRQWNTATATTTEVAVFVESYDERLARKADGTPLEPQTELEIRGLQIQESLSWQPVKWPSFKSTLRAGFSAEEEPDGAYESALRLFSSISLSWKSEWIDLRADGRWQNIRYQDRHSDFADTRPLRQTYRSLRLEAKRELIWNTSLKIAVEWSDFSSRAPSEDFSERRAEALLEWSY
jgi:hypothetical protein